MLFRSLGRQQVADLLQGLVELHGLERTPEWLDAGDVQVDTLVTVVLIMVWLAILVYK